MIMIQRFISIILTIIAALAAMAGTITGRVLDENQVPMPYANVVLMNRADSAFVQGIVTGEDGTFALTSDCNDCLLKISCVGYATRWVEARAASVGDIVMQPGAALLGEVVVKGERPAHKLGREGLLTSVEGTILSKLGTAEDVLRNIPGVLKKDGGNLEVFGKGTPLIYINNRLMRDASELNELKSQDIVSVEVITNPGAKYDASVQSVIRIKTRKVQGEGWGGHLRSSFYQGEMSRTYNAFLWNYRHHGLDIFGTVSDFENGWLQKYRITQDVAADTIWHQDNHGRSQGNYNILRLVLGTNYQFNDKHWVGFQYTSSIRIYDKSTGRFVADVLADGNFYDHLETNNVEETSHNMPHSLNIYYNGEVGKTSIDFNADYYFNKTHARNRDVEESQEWDDRSLHSVNNVRNELFASKLVLSWPLWNGTLTAGGEANYTHRNDDYFNSFHLVPSSETEVKEQNYSVFVEYSRMTPIGQVRGGLRDEYVKTGYYRQGTRIDGQSRHFNHLFPSVSLSTRVGNVKGFLSYAMKIRRPTYFELSNMTYYSNRFTWQSGNPYLKPTIINNVSLDATWKFLSLNVSYSHLRDVVMQLGRQVEGHESTTLIYQDNIDKKDVLSASLTAAPQFGLWHPQLTLSVMKEWMRIPMPTGYYSPERPIWSAQWNNTFKFSPSWTGSLSLDWQGKGDIENISSRSHQFDLYIGLTKTFLDDRLSVKVAGHDLFHRNGQDVLVHFGELTLWQHRTNETRYAEVTVRYHFNWTRSKYKGTGAGNQEKNRL
jgi:hypothetical protein